MPQRVYLDADICGSGPLEVCADEAHHMRTVMRMRAGDDVEVFDGRGNSVSATITTISKRAVIVHPKPDTLTRALTDSATNSLVIVAAVPKGDRLKWLIEKLTELNVARFVPLRTARSVVHPGSGKLNRMRATVISACKQSGRNELMEVDDLQAFEDALAAHSADAVLIAHPGTPDFSSALSTADSSPDSSGTIAVFIGPEGGFTDTEVSSATNAGAGVFSLGNHILRLETAALAAAALFSNRLRQGESINGR